MAASQSRLTRVWSYFDLESSGSTLRTEFVAGCVTFLTMAYIIVVQPAVLSGAFFGTDTGMDAGAVMVATCLASAFACIMMGVLARYPIALAPGMGANFFLVASVFPAIAATGHPHPWQVGLAVIFLSGVLFLILTLTGVRQILVRSVSPALKHGMAVGIGLFIAFIGLKNAGLIVNSPGTFVTLNADFLSPDILIFFLGLFAMAALQAMGFPIALFLGIAITTIVAMLFASFAPETWILGSALTRFEIIGPIVSAPPDLSKTAFQLDIMGALTLKMLPFIVIFLFIDVFDTMGTLVAVTHQAGFVKEDGSIPRSSSAFLTDASATVVGSALGTSTVTCYIESASGISQGGRTGLTAIVVGLFFLLALFFFPIVALIGSYPPITAPALVIVGAMMMRNLREIDFDDLSEGIPAFVIMLGIPLTFSIADGIALGIITYVAVKLLSGRAREVHPLLYFIALLMCMYFPLIRGDLG